MKLSFARAFDHWLTNKGKRPALAWTFAILWLLAIGCIAFFWHLGSIGLIDETEPLFAEASRQMVVTGDWITPYFNGETRFDKPALIYWCQAIAYSIIGVNEWAVRLPSAIAAMAVVSLGFYTLQWHLAKEDRFQQVSRPTRRWLTAGLGAAIIALNPETIVWARIGVSDMLLTGCMASALFCFFLGYAQPFKPAVQARWYLACYLLIGLAILTKGPVGIVLPGLIIALFVLYLGNWREVLREMRLVWGAVIISLVAVPWYVLVTLQNGDAFIDSFLGYHNVERFTDVVNGHDGPWYFYFLVVLLGFAPWSVYLPVAMVRLRFWRRSYWRSQERSNQLGLFALVWFVGIFGFFTIAVTKLPSYVLPLMPAAAILVALLWSDLIGTREETLSLSPRRLISPLFIQASAWMNVVFVLALAIGLFCVPYLLGPDPAAPQFDQLLEQSRLTVVGGVIWLAAAAMLLVLLLLHRWRWLIGVNLLAFVAFLIVVLMPASFLMDQERQLPLRQLSAIAVQARQPGEELVMVGFKKPTVVFYTQQSVTYIKLTAAGGDYIKSQVGKKPQSESMLILAQPKKFPEMGLQPSQYQNLGQAGAYQLIRVSESTLNAKS